MSALLAFLAALFKGAVEALASAWAQDRARQSNEAAREDLGAAKAQVAAADAERQMAAEGKAIDDAVRADPAEAKRKELERWSRD